MAERVSLDHRESKQSGERCATLFTSFMKWVNTQGFWHTSSAKAGYAFCQCCRKARQNGIRNTPGLLAGFPRVIIASVFCKRNVAHPQKK